MTSQSHLKAKKLTRKQRNILFAALVEYVMKKKADEYVKYGYGFKIIPYRNI